MSAADFDLRAEIARIDCSLAENRKFQAETDKRFEESRRLAAAALLPRSDVHHPARGAPAGWLAACAGFTVGAVVAGAIVALMGVIH